MNSQEKKRYLQQYCKLDKAIIQKLEEYDRLGSLCMKVTSTITGMPGRGNSTREDWLAKLVDMSKEINCEIDRFSDLRQEIEEAINTVGDTTLQTLLRCRYINGMSWEQIEALFNYEHSWVARLHGMALSELKLDEKKQLKATKSN